ncbi:protein of unknown function [Petrocella atlantisensis]|uniref:Uncharacterized protein n=1 Tax=Petrocella atlantisensis TaxID=2173034 RepID=A0A3P7PA28_9FIRM|nr:protein of unknown function [Petrocella atlantisensis]
MKDIYTLTRFLSMGFFDILPSATTNPKGSESTNVKANI